MQTLTQTVKSPQIATVGVLEARGVESSVGLSIPEKPHARDRWKAKLAQTWGMTGKKWELGRCKGCNCEIDPAPIALDWSDGSAPMQISVTCCDECMDLVRDSYGLRPAETQQVQMEPRWEAECPLRLRELILADAYPPHFDQSARRKVLEWERGSVKGIACKGDSGAGKTTSIWSLFRVLEREGGNPKFLTGVELNRILARASRDLDSIEWLWKCHVLMVDDIGKEKLSAGASSLLWEVVDRRYQNKLPIFLSTRFNSHEMAARFGEAHMGNDIVRRILESCRGVEFTLQTSAPTSAPKS
jgi:hypothetical protein